MDLFDLSGKTALVTGSSRGLGLMIARGLGQAGASLVLNGRDEETLQKAVGQLASEGITVCGVTFDVSDGGQVARGVAEAQKQAGGIDILVNNAGINRRGALEDIDEADWRRVIDTNLTGAFLITQAVARGMIARKAGKIINICSLMSEVARPGVAPYAAAKGGLKMLTKSMAVEWAPHNVQVNGIGPGYFVTEMTKRLTDEQEFNAWVCRRTPAGRWGKPEELIGAAVFFAGRASDFVTGQILYVDGGILATL